MAIDDNDINDANVTFLAKLVTGAFPVEASLEERVILDSVIHLCWSHSDHNK